jgi:hypothetical protein
MIEQNNWRKSRIRARLTSAMEENLDFQNIQNSIYFYLCDGLHIFFTNYYQNNSVIL